jgi:DNA-binding response OmpR family regulator
MSGEQLLVIDDSPTVLKVVEGALAQAGYRVATANGGAAGLALARELEAAPVLVLLDGDLSDNDSGLDAPACCRALAEIERLTQVPIVLMVTKGEDLDERLARAPNVIDYILRPFSPDAVLALVTRLVDRRASRATAPQPQPQPDEGEARDRREPGDRREGERRDRRDATASASATGDAPGAAPTAGRDARTAFDELRAELAQRIESFRQESGKWDLGELVHGAFDDGTLEKLLATYEVRRLGGTRDGADPPALAGDLGAITVSEILSWLQDRALTGCLHLVTRDARVELYVRRGKVDFATAVGVGEDLLLGRFAVEAGALTPEALTAVLDERAGATAKPGLFGVDLVARGLITEAQLKQAMSRQIAEVIYETLRWTEGQFSFRALAAGDLPELARDAGLAISVDSLLLEGFRRVDEWRVIEREIDDFDLIFVPNESKIAEVARGQLTRDEIAVLEFVNGRTPVKEIIRTLRLGSFDVAKILFRLLRSKLIRRRVAATAA